MVTYHMLYSCTFFGKCPIAANANKEITLLGKLCHMEMN